MKNFIVIGLGRFGTAVARELYSVGKDVLAMDVKSENVQNIADYVTHAVTGDGRDPAVLQAIGIQDYDCAVVTVGDDVGSSALITMRLKEAGVPKIICKAQSHVHQRLLEKLGADRVVFPEHEMGIKTAQGLARSNILNFIELSPEFAIVEVDPARQGWAKRTVRELDVRAKYKLNIIAVRRGGEMHVAPGADWVISGEDKLIVLGRDSDISALCGK